MTDLQNIFNPTYRFAVKIDGISYAAFSECRLPNLQVETTDIKEGGQNTYIHKLPVRVSTANVTLRHGITKNTDLLKWYLQVMQGDVESATRTVLLVMFDASHKPLITFTFYRAYPVKWTGPSLKSDEAAIAVEEVEFAHHGFEVG